MKKNNTLPRLLVVLSMSTLLFSFTKELAIDTVPFKVMLIKHSVTDFNKWRPSFDSHLTARKEAGQTDIDLLQNIDNVNEVLIVEKISDVQKAKDFIASPDLKATMEKAGVIGAPEFSFYDVIRNDEGKITTKDRIMVTHKVKNFDAWVKAYDKEGKGTRAGQGMIDRVLARGIDDPNLVHIVFAVTDMAKAKAAIGSDEKKKLMMEAGVEGAPTIEYFKQTK